jgi:3-phosphoshikimate 1-carboxyvinyltransferase
MGALVRELERPDRLPHRAHRRPAPSLDHRSPHASAQIKSAVLLAGLSGRVSVSVHEPALSRDHTERMLASLGARLESGPDEGGWRVRLSPPEGHLAPLQMRVPGDPSSAAFLVALALLADSGELRVRDVCLNPTSVGFLAVVRRMGGRCEIADERREGGEPVGDLIVPPPRSPVRRSGRPRSRR